VKLASEYGRVHAAGAELAAVSVDDEVRQAGMSKRWGFTHTRFVSDPGGASYLQAIGLFDPDERGGIALPGMVVVNPDGVEVYRYQGRDFADRTNDDDLWAAIEALGLPAVDPPPWVPGVEVPGDMRGFFRPADFNAYFRGNVSGAAAIGRRVADDASRELVQEHRLMSQSMLEAWTRWEPNISGPREPLVR
jgi:hypothetical protein